MHNIVTTAIFATCLFFFSYIFNNTSIVDMGWGSLGILLILDSLINQNISLLQYLRVEILDLKMIDLSLFIFGYSIILIYSLRHVVMYISHFKGLDIVNEDFRYKEFKSKYGFNDYLFWTVNYFLLHQIPLIILALAYQPIFQMFYSIINKKVEIIEDNSVIYSVLGFIIATFALICETIADEQLAIFRKEKEKLMEKEPTVGSRVIYIGLWKFLRHPNYFGEVIYFFSLLVFISGLGVKLLFVNSIGFIAMASIFIFYSVPAMEKYLLNKYKEEYVRYKNKVRYRIIPFVY